MSEAQRIESLEQSVAELREMVKKVLFTGEGKKWLTMEEMKLYTNYSTRTLYGLRHFRGITTRKCGGLQFEKASVDAYLKSTERRSNPELLAEVSKTNYKAA